MRIITVLFTLTLAGCGGGDGGTVPSTQLPSNAGEVKISCAGVANTNECYEIPATRAVPSGTPSVTIDGGTISRSQTMSVTAEVSNSTLTDFFGTWESWLEIGCMGESGFLLTQSGIFRVAAGTTLTGDALRSTRQCSAMPLGPNAMYAIVYDAQGVEVDRVKVTYTVVP